MQTCTITLLHLSTHKTFFLSFRQYLKNWANRNFKAFFGYLNTPFTTADSKTFQVFLLYESSHLSLFQFYLMKAATILQKYCIFYCVKGMWCTWSFKKGGNRSACTCRKLDSSTDHLTCWHFVSKLGRSCERWARYHWYSFHVKNQILPMSDNVSKWSWVDRWSFPIKSMQSTYKSPPDSPGKISLVLYHVVKDLTSWNIM